MPNKKQSKKAKLRVCASCEWIFKEKRHPDTGGCPKCGFAHYGARFVYGDKAYKYAKTQKPWMEKKLQERQSELQLEIERTGEFKDPSTVFSLKLRAVKP
jgi:predicted  nucleic acid-binding Zn-ribbon protein